jgi:peptidoglycan/xylan/chitin deacetylase (PgdA/CDA1 family)
MLPSALLLLSPLLGLVHAHDDSFIPGFGPSCGLKSRNGLSRREEGSLIGPTTSQDAAGYSCDPSKCKLPTCNCASTSPPGGLDPKDVPQFIVFTADDAIQTYTLDAVNQFLSKRKNPNGCPVKMTYYTSLSYTNYSLVTDWFVAGNEIADHTMTHVGSPPSSEINGNLITLNALAGIPLRSIQGFRAPYLNYSVDTLKQLAAAKFTYDSSATSSIPVTDPGTDAYWPYTLDNGLANDCLSVPNICKGEPKLPGFWEIPMYAFFDNKGVAGPHLMDPWLDAANGANSVNNSATLEYMKNTFTAHYNNNRQPIGLYTHPIHVSLSVPGSTADKAMVAMINEFLDWAQEQQNVWIVSSEQLLAWVQNPTKLSDLNNFAGLKCSTPQVDKNICNGMPDKEKGLLAKCAFSDAPFNTCYGCPVEQPSPSNPNPAQATDSAPARHRLPANCSTPFWDPIDGKCLCTSDSCAFADDSRPIGENGANLTGGQSGTSASASATTDPYAPFNGSGAVGRMFDGGVRMALLFGLVGVLVGAAGVVGRV